MAVQPSNTEKSNRRICRSPKAVLSLAGTGSGFLPLSRATRLAAWTSWKCEPVAEYFPFRDFGTRERLDYVAPSRLLGFEVLQQLLAGGDEHTRVGERNGELLLQGAFGNFRRLGLRKLRHLLAEIPKERTVVRAHESLRSPSLNERPC